MAIRFTPYVLPLLVSSGILVWLAIYGWRNWREPAAWAFVGAMVSLLIWSAGYALEIISVELSAKIYWANLQFLGIGAAPLFVLMMTLGLTGRKLLPTRTLVVLGLIPLITNILAWTDPWHHLFRGQPSIDNSGPIALLSADYGMWVRGVFNPYQYLMYGATLLILLQALIEAPRLYRIQYTLLFLAIALPLAASVVYVLGVPPFANLNPTAPVFSLAGIVFAIAMFRHRILDVIPIARDAVIEHLDYGVIMLDHRDRLLDFNPAAQRIVPILQESAIGQPILQALLDAQDNVAQQIASGKPETDLTMAQGEAKRYYQSRLSLVRDQQGQVLGKTILLIDITQQLALLARMREVAATDELTGIANRRHFLAMGNLEIGRAQRYGHAVSVAFLDLDLFKKVNDVYGHTVGDKVLCHVARLCQSNVRTIDIFARYGGEEFVLLFPETPPHAAVHAAERLRTTIANTPLRLDDAEIHVTVSLGIAGTERLGKMGLADLVDLADQALAQAKASGRNRVVMIQAPQQ